MPSELIKEQPSLLSQIVNEVEKLDDEEKKKLLIQLCKEEILNTVKSFDSVRGSKKTNAMTDVEVDTYISDQRKLRYEQSKA